VPAAAIIAVAVLAIGTGIALGIFRATPADVSTTVVDVSAEAVTESVVASDVASEETTATGTMVEVPDVTGSHVDDADALLEIAGFEVVHATTPAGDAKVGTVLAQDPAPGSVMVRGTTIMLTYASNDTNVTTTAALKADATTTGRVYVVCIDPGHQDKANNDKEPIGPGSKTLKAKVTGGASGAVTKQRESNLVLKISVRLKKELEAQGVRVVMTRTTGAVDISNAQRAEVANAAEADLFIRIHADGNTNGDIRGLSSLYPAGNDWVKPITANSLTAAKAIHNATLFTTGAKDRGILPRSDISGFNWSKVPSVIVETGFLSNPVEDKLLASEAYQAKLAEGMSRGIMAYLKGE
jgi:N-acetylmuramoyl-L-alanine amidase